MAYLFDLFDDNADATGTHVGALLLGFVRMIGLALAAGHLSGRLGDTSK